MSEKFETVKGYYDRGLWSAERVRNAVGKWITEEERAQILGEEWEEDGPKTDQGPTQGLTRTDKD